MALHLLMRFLCFVSALSSIINPVFSKPLGNPCLRPVVRKEWRTLGRTAQKDYLDAVKCILRKPAITPKSVSPGAVARFDDFITTHIIQTFSIHYVGHFLPWHRYFTAVYEKALRHECGYTGAQPYWDWNLDVPPFGTFTKSPVWDADFGFGGNGPFVEVPADNPLSVPGRTGGGCVSNGPFKNMVVNMGPASNLTGNPRCLSRDFSPYFAGRYLGANVTKLTLSQNDFGWFDRVVEGGPSFDASGLHGGGHYGVGGTLGEMGDLYNSPSDPIFYLHHANLDRVWWSWQKKDLSRRLVDISGPINLLDYDNVLGGNVTLSFPLSLGLNAPNVTIADVMDINGGTLCYEYDRVYNF
ncbi:hypothetical protein GALMADRAFT_222927 [Galerina marginata CBS 339.88]|uniref:Tyrosinase copper-binding domain-containing protein n=1 Tax=Galerina marginata (strain CBS 339.88) TaxID=685588 RepID=A0A067TCE7_GALM3|nr:hypothetical protein GALMADRAFT_222927 [Galerina marginata CBS 339.88]